MSKEEKQKEDKPKTEENNVSITGNPDGDNTKPPKDKDIRPY
jgi:hypothetical protein